MNESGRLPLAPRYALARATAALLDAERVVLAGGTVDEDAFDHLVSAYCRAAQALEASWATTAGTTASTRWSPGRADVPRAEPLPRSLVAGAALSVQSA